MTILELTKAAREKIAKPERWTSGVEARDKNGKEVDADSETATCWCSYAAFETSTTDTIIMEAAVRRFEDMIGFPICLWNDNPLRTHEEVISTFDRLIGRMS